MRNLTKASREASRAAQFEFLKSKGWQHETYKGLDIFKNVADLLLKVFQGTAAEPIFFYRYKSLESLEAKIIQAKQNYDSREAWKAEQKDKNKGKSSSHAATAAAIRAELKKHFEGVKFSVTSESFAGGDACRISWTEGPTAEEVNKITSNYQMGHFNGMEDIYEYNENKSNLPQVKYVTTSRGSNPETLKQIEEGINSLMDLDKNDYRNSPEQIAYRLFNITPFPASFEAFKVVRNSNDSGVGLESFFNIEFIGTPEKVEEVKSFENVKPSAEGEIQVLEYSEKSFAVIGEGTKNIKDALLNLGGKYNKFLKCGAGFIFSNKNLEKVIEFLKSIKPEEKPQEIEEQEPNNLNITKLQA